MRITKQLFNTIILQINKNKKMKSLKIKCKNSLLLVITCLTIISCGTKDTKPDEVVEKKTTEEAPASIA